MDYDPLASAYQRNREASSAVVEELIAEAAVDRASRVLEVGCGTGNHIIALQQMTACRAAGLDPSTAMLAHTCGRDEGVDFVIGGAEQLDGEDESLDLIYNVDVIHHLDNRPAFFAEAYRCLRPGGRLATFTHSHALIEQGGAILRRYFPETVAADQARYPDIDVLRDEMEQNGFADLAEKVVAYPVQVTDSRPYEEKAYSALHLIDDEAFARGLRALGRDLEQGPITGLRRHLALWGRKALS